MAAILPYMKCRSEPDSPVDSSVVLYSFMELNQFLQQIIKDIPCPSSLTSLGFYSRLHTWWFRYINCAHFSSSWLLDSGTLFPVPVCFFYYSLHFLLSLDIFTLLRHALSLDMLLHWQGISATSWDWVKYTLLFCH